MVYLAIAFTIVIYFFIVIRIFHGINDDKTVSFITRLKSAFRIEESRYS